MLSNKNRTLSNRKGFTLTEVMIAAGLMTIISLGVATLFQNITSDQLKTGLVNSLRDSKIKFTNVIQDRQAWVNTMAVPGNNMGCLTAVPAVACTPVATTAPNALTQIMDKGNNNFYTGASWVNPTTAVNGFTSKGQSCSTFNAAAGAGNDACPVGFRMAWEPICPAVGTCKNPAVKITVRLIYNPSPSGSLRSFINSIAISNVDTATALGKYDFQIIRAANGVTRTFTLVHSDPTGTVGGGSCGSARPFTEDLDPYDLVSVSGTSFTIQPGNYNCSLSAVGYSSGNFTARVLNTTAATTVSTYTNQAPTGTQSPVNFNFNINLSTASTFQIDQTCEYPPATPSLALGLSGASFGGAAQTFATLICTAIDEAVSN